MTRINVILISSVRPEPTTGGQLILHRHLTGGTDIKLSISSTEPIKLTFSSVIRRLIGRLGRTRLHRFSEDFWVLWKGRWLDASLSSDVTTEGRTVVLTVAHGSECMAALRFAEKHKLPLITFFHDWFPDIPDVHPVFRRFLEKDFRILYRCSSAALCVCEGMRDALGENLNASILYPVSEQPGGAQDAEGPVRRNGGPLKIFYFGNLFEYGPMLGEALKQFDGGKKIRLEVRGANPNWPAEFREAMRERGLWKDFLPRNELNAWLSEAGAFLIPMVFEAQSRRRMETSFPSKLIEFAQWGKPLIVWGPEYCSAIKWARQGNRALCITDPNPEALRTAVENLSGSSEEQQRLAIAARQAGQTEFNPNTIQVQFMEILKQTVERFS